MKYEVHKGFPISFKKYCDVKVEGFECSLYTSQLWYYACSGVEQYSALIIPFFEAQSQYILVKTKNLSLISALCPNFAHSFWSVCTRTLRKVFVLKKMT